MKTEPVGFELVEHTADIALQVRGKTLSQLFNNAALGMTSYLFEELPEGLPSERKEVSLISPDLETLLVDWLSQLLLISSSTYRAIVACDVSVGEGQNGWQVQSEIHLSQATATNEIKAVTFSYLEIKRTSAGVETEITFDI